MEDPTDKVNDSELLLEEIMLGLRLDSRTKVLPTVLLEIVLPGTDLPRSSLPRSGLPRSDLPESKSLETKSLFLTIPGEVMVGITVDKTDTLKSLFLTLDFLLGVVGVERGDFALKLISLST